MTPLACGKCSAPIAHDRDEACWWCNGAMCYACWDEHGHCGHAEAEAFNEASRRASPDERRKLAHAAFGGEGFEWLGPVPEKGEAS